MQSQPVAVRWLGLQSCRLKGTEQYYDSSRVVVQNEPEKKKAECVATLSAAGKAIVRRKDAEVGSDAAGEALVQAEKMLVVAVVAEMVLIKVLQVEADLVLVHVDYSMQREEHVSIKTANNAIVWRVLGKILGAVSGNM